MATMYPFGSGRGANQNYGIMGTDQAMGYNNAFPRAFVGRFNYQSPEEVPTNINYPNLGQPLYPPTEQPRVPDYISSSERPAYQDQPGFFKQMFNKVRGAPLGLLNLITRRQGADQSFEGYPGGFGSRAGLFPQEVANLQAVADSGYLGGQGQDIFGTNVVSQFGDYDKAMEKNLGVFQQTMADKGLKDLDELEDYYKQYGDRSYILNKLRHVRNMTERNRRTNVDQTTSGVDQTTSGGKIPVGPISQGGTGTSTSTYSGPETKSFNPSQFARAGRRATRPGGFTDPGQGSYGPWKAEGGRVGYREGELVEDESMMAETPTGMMEENIEEVQGEPTREQMEALAMEIFQLRLEELDEEQLMIVYQTAMEQAPQEEVVEEGIASLV